MIVTEQEAPPAIGPCELRSCHRVPARRHTIYRGVVPDWVNLCDTCAKRPDVAALMRPPLGVRPLVTPASAILPALPLPQESVMQVKLPPLPPLRADFSPSMCRLVGCEAAPRGRGLCQVHYNQAYREGRLDELALPSARPIVQVQAAPRPAPAPEAPAGVQVETQPDITILGEPVAAASIPAVPPDPPAEDTWSEDDLDDFASVTITASGRAALTEAPPTLEQVEAQLLVRLEAISELKRLPQEIRDGDEMIVLLGLDGRWELARHPSLDRKLRAVVNLALHTYRIDLERVAYGSAS